VDLPKCKKDFSSYRIHLDAHITTIVDGNRNSVKRDSSAMFLLALLRLGGSWCVFVLKYCLGCGRVFLTPGLSLGPNVSHISWWTPGCW